MICHVVIWERYQRLSHFQSFTCKKLIALLSVLSQNGHPGGQIWLWESATAESGHVSVHQPQTAGGGAAARPGLPDQQQVGHLLDYHILSVTCAGFQSYLNNSELLSNGLYGGHNALRVFSVLYLVATKLVTSAFRSGIVVASLRLVVRDIWMIHLETLWPAGNLRWQMQKAYGRLLPRLMASYVHISESVSATVRTWGFICVCLLLCCCCFFLHYPQRS